MENPDETYIILAVVLIIWCALHSILISRSLTAVVRRRLGRGYRFYRLFFTIFSALTLIPVAVFAFKARTTPVFSWDGTWRIAQILLLIVSGAFFILGAGRYDIGRFLGTRQIREKEENGAGLAEAGMLDVSGVLSVVRHPWYLAGILLVWARPLYPSTLVVNIVVCAYFIIGAYLEERKLIAIFGQTYLDYQKRVPMFIPLSNLTFKGFR